MRHLTLFNILNAIAMRTTAIQIYKIRTQFHSWERRPFSVHLDVMLIYSDRSSNEKIPNPVRTQPRKPSDANISMLCVATMSCFSCLVHLWRHLVTLLLKTGSLAPLMVMKTASFGGGRRVLNCIRLVGYMRKPEQAFSYLLAILKALAVFQLTNHRVELFLTG